MLCGAGYQHSRCCGRVVTVSLLLCRVQALKDTMTKLTKQLL